MTSFVYKMSLFGLAAATTLVVIPSTQAKAPAKVNFAEHIAPLIHNNCTQCHRPKQAAPFPLITYKDVRRRSRTIQAVLDTRYMPPWHPEPSSVKFQNDRRLSEEQIALFNAWVKADMPEGDPSKMPPMPKFPAGGWQLGKPDLIITMDKAYPVPADGPDVFRSFVLPLNLKENKWVRAVELRPAARNAVHHVLFFLDSTGQAKRRDGRDGKPGFFGMVRPTGSLGGYVPGSTPQFLPEGLAWPLSKGSDLVLQTHFHPTGKPEQEKAMVGLYFAKEAPKKNLVGIQVPPVFGLGKGIDIPAGERAYKVEDRFTLPTDVIAYDVGGHAHYICQKMKMTAKLPDGKEKTLLQIEDWDLDWQDRYRFQTPVRLPAGTVVSTQLIYDNSEDNPDNPNSPPKRIRWGQQSTDEMGSVSLIVTAAEKSDERQLRRALSRYRSEGLRNRFGGLLGQRVGSAEEFFRRLDRNKDGKWQKSEIPSFLRDRLFPEYDKNKDDVLDQDELKALQNRFRRRRDR